MPDKIDVAAEAICGGLHANDFEFVAETEAAGEHGLTTWWHRGDRPYDVRIGVIRSTNTMVLVNIEWRVLKTPPVKGTKIIRIDCNASADKIREATADAVWTCLSVYGDVLGGTGVADPRRAVSNKAQRLGS